MLFRDKIGREPDDLLKVEMALAGAQKIIPPGADITLQNLSDRGELHFWVRYILAPDYVAYRTHQFDTILAIASLSKCDSVANQIAAEKRRVLWQNKDAQYCYYLTCSHK